MSFEKKYVLETFPVQVTENGTWGQKDVPDYYNNGEFNNFSAVSDIYGQGDQGEIPLLAFIKAEDDLTHSVCAANFKINQQAPNVITQISTNSIIPLNGWEEDAIDTGSLQYEWSSQAGSTLPPNVWKIQLIDDETLGCFLNTSIDCDTYNQQVGIQFNKVAVLVWLDPSTELANLNIEAIIDLDGNAKEICGQDGSGVPSDIVVTLQLAGKSLGVIGSDGMVNTDNTPNATVSLYPWGFGNLLNGGYIGNYSPTINGSNGIWGGESGWLPGTRCTNTKASYRFTIPSNNSNFSNNSALYASQGESMKTYWFYVIPDEGYVVSRHLFRPQIDSSQSTGGSDGSHDFYGDNLSWSTSRSFGAVVLPYQEKVNAFAGTMSTINTYDSPDSGFYFTSACSEDEGLVAGYGFPPFGIGTGGVVGSNGSPTSQETLSEWQTAVQNQTQWFGVTAYSNIYVDIKYDYFGSYTIERWNQQEVNGTFGGNSSLEPVTSDGGPGYSSNVQNFGEMQVVDSGPYPFNGFENSDVTTYGVYGSGYDLAPTFNELPDNWCTTDFVGNKLIIGIREIANYQPGNSMFPKELRFRLIGAAVELIEDEECVSCVAEIECD